MKITVNDTEIECSPEETLLSILRENGIHIPTLCYQEGLVPEGRCRLCIVESEGKLIPSCVVHPVDGMVIETQTAKVKRARRVNTELLFSEHIKTDKLIEGIEQNLPAFIKSLGVRDVRFDSTRKYDPELGASVIRNNNLCINCGRCVQVCGRIQATWAIDFSHRAHHEHVTPYFEHNLGDVACTKCGQCIAACPVGAISEREHIPEVLQAIENPKKHVVVQIAPSIRVSIGEEFDMEPGSIVTGKLVAALRRCGFDKVFDTDFAADLTIVEEGIELIERVTNFGPFPMITTCCPAWIKFMEHFYHDLIPNMSSCKSPHEMMGRLIKTYYAEKYGLKKRDIVVVSIMPCTAKKFESTRKELKSDVDYVLTTRETAKLIKHFNIDFVNIVNEEFDPTLGISTGAGLIFGATGGVMEAALRSAYWLVTGESSPKLEFDQIRGLGGIREGLIILKGRKIRFAVANGLNNARRLLKRKERFHFIEIMACPGGCINGGGQPLPFSKKKIQKRINALYQQDVDMPLRESHKNPLVQQLYKEFLGKPRGKMSKKLLHTRYYKRSPF